MKKFSFPVIWTKNGRTFQQCPCITKRREPCRFVGEDFRLGFCHIHDPLGNYRKQHPYGAKQKRVERKARIKEKRAKRKIRRKNKQAYSKKIRGTPVQINGQEPGYIYLFYLGMDNYYKIGKSKNWKQRLNSFRIANPKIQKVHIVEVGDMTAAEKVIQKRFKSSKHEREIFRFENTVPVIYAMNKCFEKGYEDES